jgi:hypothetical protein
LTTFGDGFAAEIRFGAAAGFRNLNDFDRLCSQILQDKVSRERFVLLDEAVIKDFRFNN